MVSTYVLLLILALVCFVISAFTVSIPRVNLVSLGLAFGVAAILLNGS